MTAMACVRNLRVAAAALVTGSVLLAGCTATRQAQNQASSRLPTAAPSQPTETQGPLPRSGRVWLSQTELDRGESTPVEDPYYPRTSNPEIDTLHYNLALAWDRTILTGRTTIAFRATEETNSVMLDMSTRLSVAEVALDGSAMAYIQVGDSLVIDVIGVARNSRHTLTIDYSGVPKPVRAPSRRSDLDEGLGWTVDPTGDVYTFQEPYGAFTWYPVHDHPSDKALYDVQVTVPKGQVAVFNGQLVGQSTQRPGTTTWRWHTDEPMASYLTTIAIGPYRAYHETMPDGTPATYWLLPQDRALAPRLEREARTAFGWLEERLGPYPFDTFGIVIVDGASGMETQTMITLSRGALNERDAVVAHEIAHQWFGDAVTPDTWQGLWLSEGWAMYMQQWFEKDTGRYEYGGGMSRWRPLDNESRARSGPPGDYDPRTFADLNVYLGPAMMLDAIRERVGDSRFQALARSWVADHEYGNVDRAEFVRWLNAKTGKDFRPLVHLWLDSPRTPM